MSRHLMPAAVLAFSAAATPAAYAQTTPSLVVDFVSIMSPVSAAPVPLGPLALLLSVLAIGLAVLLGKRKGPSHWLSLPVLAAVVGLGLSQPDSTQAEMVQRTLDLQASPASLALNTQISERLLVRNTTGQALRITSLGLKDGTDTMRLFTPNDTNEAVACKSGLVLTANQACAIEVVVSENFVLQAGSFLQVKLRDLHPTQPAVGYDQIYYHLARKQPDLNRFAEGTTNYTRQIERTELKRAQDYCEDTGRNSATDYVARSVSLINGTGFSCTVSEANVDASKLKTVVVGPNGQLYLTDGHHTFTTLWELKDGGPDLPVFVRVAANFSDNPDLSSFWSQMQANNYVWLRDANGATITPAQLPTSLGLATLADDPYRSLVYLTRDMGYKNSGVPEFAEFYWGMWLRGQGLDVNDYDLRDLTPAGVVVVSPNHEIADTGSTTSYVAAVRDAALLMRQLTPGAEIAPGLTGTQFGQNTSAMTQNNWDTLLQEEVWQDDARESDNRYRNGGKAWYATGYRLCGAPADNADCWQTNMIVDHTATQ
ncbi:midcut-by-XrtH protein [Lampropedia aestuarii]|uniref:Midcut-by-XrtH protein n=1 Tax=Lampropedia aestuarii TaxID=2562762 RepID=A0A4S5BW11_9BURK|nr:midcut-by-XrtH protein [Lampropedia aestuarii]THJ35265.1 midcut-by-XrtH protein [Lampropedia aestuarii]